MMGFLSLVERLSPAESIVRRMLGTLVTTPEEIGTPLTLSGNKIDTLSDLKYQNPDDLIQKKGFLIYNRMLDEDADVRWAYQMKLYTRLSGGWKIEPAVDNNPAAKERADFVRWCFENLEGGFEPFLLKIWDGMRVGYKIAEKIHSVLYGGPWRGKIGLTRILVRNSENYSFDADDHGLIKADGLIERPGLGTGMHGERRMPIEKFIIFTWNPLDDDATSLYGRSDFRAIFRYFYSNDALMRLRDQRLEKYSRPPAVGTFPSSALSKDQDSFLGALEDIHDRDATILPEGFKVEFPEVPTTEEAFGRAMEFNSTKIKVGLLMGSLLSEPGLKGGFALSKTHLNLFLMVLDFLALVTEETIIFKQIIKQLVDLNWAVMPGEDPLYPRFKMPRYALLADEEAKRVRAEIIQLWVDAGLIDPDEPWVRDFIGAPPRTASQSDGVPIEIPDDKDVSDPTELPTMPSIFGHADTPRRALFEAEKKLNITEIKENLDGLDEEGLEDISAGFRKTLEELQSEIMAAYKKRDAKAISKIKAKTEGIRDAIYRTQARSLLQGMKDSDGEIARAKG